MTAAILAEALDQRAFAITLELVPSDKGPAHTADRAESFAQAVRACGHKIHAFSITDNAGGRPGAAASAAAVEIQRRGLCAMVHISCRDSNRMAIEARLRGLSNLGIRHFLIVTGDYPAVTPAGRAAAVFDLDSVQATRLAKGLVSAATVGAAVSPFKNTEAELMTQFFKMERKIAAGADFIICQVGYELRRFLETKAYLVSRGLKTPILGNVYVLTPAAARAMNEGAVPGCVVPKNLLAEIEKAASDAAQLRNFRIQMAANMLAVFRGAGFQGAHIGGFGLKPEELRQMLEQSVELEKQWPELVERVAYALENEFHPFQSSILTESAIPEDPVKNLPSGRISFFYSMMKVAYRLIFDQRSRGFRIMRAFYSMIDPLPRLTAFFHLFERCVKFILFQCRDCGDCALHDMAYCCPQAKCFKNQRNGPCGGSKNGMCEVDTSRRRCVWTIVYNRMKGSGEVATLRQGYVPARNHALDGTSGWANYFLGRDHAQVISGSAQKANGMEETG